MNKFPPHVLCFLGMCVLLLTGCTDTDSETLPSNANAITGDQPTTEALLVPNVDLAKSSNPDFNAVFAAAKNGDVDCQYRLAVMYEKGEHLPKNEKEALKWYRKAAGHGNFDAQYALGTGTLVLPDRVERSKWMLLAAGQGDPIAQHSIGIYYARGDGVPEDEKKAVAWFRKSAEQGFAMAQADLGQRYSTGEGIKQNHTEAEKWLRKGAVQGDDSAQHNLGAHYAMGATGSPDMNEAAKWFRKAAEQGMKQSQMALAVLCQQGATGSPDMEEAAKWFRKAAEQGMMDAQYNLALMHEKGDGVQKNDIIAYAWLSVLPKQDVGAAKAIERIMPRLTAAELEDAKKMGADFRDKYGSGK